MDIVEFIAVLIGAEGAKTRSKMQKTHFLLRCFFREDYSTSCGSSGTGETPQEQSDEEAHRPPHGKRSAGSGNQQTCLTPPFYKKKE
jgi:hypothetical protein